MIFFSKYRCSDARIILLMLAKWSNLHASSTFCKPHSHKYSIIKAFADMFNSQKKCSKFLALTFLISLSVASRLTPRISYSLLSAIFYIPQAWLGIKELKNCCCLSSLSVVLCESLCVQQ